MGVDIRQLSPAAQRQVLQKLAESQKTKARAALAAKKDKNASKAKAAQSANKYGNQKVEIDGILFDSKREARRYLELAALEKAGEIQDLKRQVKYELLPNQRIDGKVVERAVSYVADFVYEQNGETVVEDAKGCKTPEYKLKKKLMLWVHGIVVKEV